MNFILPHFIKKRLASDGQLNIAVGAIMLLFYWPFLILIACLSLVIVFAFMLKAGVWSTFLVHFLNSYDFIQDLSWFNYDTSFMSCWMDFKFFLDKGLHLLDQFLSTGSFTDKRHFVTNYSLLLNGILYTSIYLLNYPINFVDYSSIEGLPALGDLVYTAIFIINFEQAFMASLILRRFYFYSGGVDTFLNQISLDDRWPEIYSCFEQFLPIFVIVYLPIALGIRGSFEEADWLFKRHSEQFNEIFNNYGDEYVKLFDELARAIFT